MTHQPDLSTFERRLAERKAREEAERTKAKNEADQFDPDLIPEAAYERTEVEQEIDNAIERIDPIQAYITWIGKMIPKATAGQTENIMISCPIPGHEDKDPSAWMNDEGLWKCGRCEEGGDKYDFAAINYGVWSSGRSKPYKSGAEFHRLREKMARDFGYTVQVTPGGSTLVIPPAESDSSEPEERPEPPAVADVIHLIDDDDDEPELPSFDWRPVVPENTFLDAYMKATVVDDVPEEFHFFHALLALGFALGRNATLFDSVPVYGNLFICTLGRSGTGKSKARRHLDTLVERALPYDAGSVPSQGVLRVSTPGSAESLIHAFMEPVEDPTNPKRIAFYAPVKGLIDFNELSSLIARTNRQGSAMKPTLMQFYDMEKVIQSTSMTTGRKMAMEPFASALTTSQPKALKGLLDESDDSSGFLNRWVFVPGKEKKRHSVGGVKVDIEPCIKPLQRVHGWAGTFKTDEQIEWSPEAYVLWDKFFQDTLEPLRRKARTDLLVRMDLTLKKLMLLFAANRHERTLSEQSVVDALYCFPYLKAAYGVPEAQIGNSINNEISEVIMRQIEKYHDKGGISVGKIWENTKHRKFDKKRMLDVLTTLVKMGLVEESAVNTGRVGRPTVRYRRAS